MPKIGLEIHGYLNTKEKLFCNCEAIHGAKLTKPNENICPICTGQPGSKPMPPNKRAIDKSIKIALILNCKINSELVWMRKHYDWADLPKGYQNTISGAHAIPLGKNGNLLGIRIRECHLEEDPASWNPKTGEIDYNKSGSPLIEIVTEPDFKSAEEVTEWIKQLKLTLEYIKAIDKNSGLKADVNISLPEFKGERVEVKNINSIKNIRSAIEYEIERQKNPNETSKKQETRMFDESKGKTIKMRSKELAEDYRFIPDPDLHPIRLKKDRINLIKKSLPETPQKKLKKLLNQYKIPERYAKVLSNRLDLAEFFEEVISKTTEKKKTREKSTENKKTENKKTKDEKTEDKKAKSKKEKCGKDEIVSPLLVSKWISIELLRVLKSKKVSLDDEEINIEPDHFVELLNMLQKKRITEQQAKKMIMDWIPNSHSPYEKLKGKEKISNEKEIEVLVSKVIKQNPKAIDDFKKGKENALNFLIGQIMKETKGRADNQIVKKILKTKIVF